MPDKIAVPKKKQADDLPHMLHALLAKLYTLLNMLVLCFVVLGVPLALTCPSGWYLMFNPDDQNPILCSQDRDCSVGNKCVYISSLQDTYCCSRSPDEYGPIEYEPNGCLRGQHAYIEPNSLLPYQCELNGASNRCPYNFLCQYSGMHERYICCSGEALVNVRVQSGQIPNPGAHSMQAAIICGTRQPLIQNNMVRSCGPSVPCPFGYTCITGPLGGASICCSDNLINSFETNGCLPGQEAYILPNSNVPVQCELNGASNRCPDGYLCQYSGLHQRYICCRRKA
uniref:EB domain-containing protein n=1 Tax=Trichuris muris TaxID=70415 RepID=A0A5S6QJ99_TRIMR